MRELEVGFEDISQGGGGTAGQERADPAVADGAERLRGITVDVEGDRAGWKPKRERGERAVEESPAYQPK